MKYLAAVALLLLPLVTEAKVLVYRGTIKVVTAAPPIDSLPTLINVYYLIDPDTNQISSVSYYTKAGQKHQIKSPPETVYIASAAALKGKTLTGLTYADRATLTDVNNFDTANLLLRGTNSTLKVTTMGLSQTFNFPKVLQGAQQIISSSSGGGGLIVVTNFVLGYQKAKSIGVNDAGTSIADATTAISQQLQDKGFLP